MALLCTAWNCVKNDQQTHSVKIAPIVTRVTETSFESGDAIGLTIVRSNGTYVTNERLAYDGNYFSGSLNWYNDNTASATLKAYYPYQSSVPTSFTVQTNQTNGLSSSDFVSSVVTDVYPTANAVPMFFKHRFCRLSISVTNSSSYQVNGVTIKGAIPSATIGSDLTASVNTSASSADIKAYKASAGQYYAIVPPQRVALTACVNLEGKDDISSALTETLLEAGKQYSVSITVENETLRVTLSSEVENWANGGTISSQSAPVVSNTIYYGFGNSAQYVYENGLKKENVTSAMGRYTATNNEPTVYYFNLLIPASMTQPYDFTMGGAPMGMDTFNVRFDNKDYIHYQSYGRYAQGVTISMIAQE